MSARRPNAPERAAYLTRKLDQSREEQRVTTTSMRHSPTCTKPGVALERGFSITVARCVGCGAVTATTRHGTNPQPKKETS